MMAGMTVVPVRSTRFAPAGASSSAAGPSWTNRPPSTTKAAFSMGGLPSPTISPAPSNTTALEAGVSGDSHP